MVRKSLLLVVFLALACASKPKFDSQFNQLSLKMTTDQVKTLLGPPDLREAKEGLETWHYNQADGRYVQFKDNGVVSFGRPQALGGPAKSSEPAVSSSPAVPVAPKNIGLACNEDEECLSGNCHMGKCSGKNNCYIAEGGVCPTDNTCCSGFCDFGICKKRR